MNNRWKRVVASTLVLSMALGGATAASAAGNGEPHRGRDAGYGLIGGGHAVSVHAGHGLALGVHAGHRQIMGLAGGKFEDKSNGKSESKTDGNSGKKAEGKAGGKARDKASYKLDPDHLKLEFDDVSMDWARPHIAVLVAKGVVEGYADGTFQPNKPVTRLEALVTAVRLMDLREEAESAAKKKATLHFKDAHKIGDWARGYVAVALENDLFFETEDKLQPEKPADRLWVTTLLIKALDLEDEARAKMTAELTFKDAAAIPAGAVGYVAVAVERGIVKGYADNTFRPNRPVTRAEIAAFLDRAGEQLPEYTLGGVLQSAVRNNRLTLANGDVYEVDDDAYVFDGDRRIDIGSLRAGDRISFITYNDVVIFVKLIRPADAADDGATETLRGTLEPAFTFSAEGELETLVLDESGKLDAIAIRHTVNGNRQTSIYRAADAVKITGDTTALLVGADVLLKGDRGVVTEIVILSSFS
mgnify:CR=1 FL=1|jgi:hypothetical protein